MIRREVQAAIIAHLLADPTLVGLVSDRVYAEPPREDAVFPFIRVIELPLTSDDTDRTLSWQGTIILEIQSQPAGSIDSLEAYTISDALYSCLHRQETAVNDRVPSAQIYNLIHERSTVIRESSGRGWVGTSFFTIFINKGE